MSMLHHSVSALYSPSPSPSPAPDALRSYMHAPRLPGMPTGLGAPPWDTLFGHGSEWVGAKPEPDVGAQQGAEEEARCVSLCGFAPRNRQAMAGTAHSRVLYVVVAAARG
jgi:hypothetical protein